MFDLDGTLIDSVPDITLAVAELMQTEGLASFGEGEVRRMVGYGVPTLVQRAFIGRGITLDEAELGERVQRMLGIYPKHLVGRTTLMPGAREALSVLAAQGRTLAVVTNKPQAATETILRHFALAEMFGVILGDSGMIARKPKPDMLLFALEQLHVLPADAVMVGDSAADVQSAAAAGVFSVGVRGGYSVEPIESFKPGLVIDTLAELPAALGESRKI